MYRLRKRKAEGARDRFRPAPTAGIAIETRDEELLTDLYRHQMMTRGQLQELYFGSVTRANTRLRLLFDHGYVRRIYRSETPFGSQAIYQLGPAGIAIVSGHTGCPVPDIRRQVRQGTPTFIEHTLKIVDFRLALRKALSESTSVRLASWLPEMLCRHEYEFRTGGRGSWHQATFKPDAYFRLCDNRTGVAADFFVEIDLGHTSSRQFARKIDLHRQYLDSGLFRTTYSAEALVTTGSLRMENLVKIAEDKQPNGFLFTTFAAIADAGPLGLIWHAPFSNAAATLLDCGREHVETED